MSLKVIFETPAGERVERTLNANWSTDCCLDLGTFHGLPTAEQFKEVVSENIADELSPALVKEMLDELAQKAK